jgi:FkbM family methyltransferase
MKDLVYPKLDSFGNAIDPNTLYIDLIKREIYEDEIYKTILHPGMVIVDVGANIGLTVQFMQPYAKRLLAIEPSPEHFDCLFRNKLNNNWTNVEIFNIAISDKNGSCEFAFNILNRTMNTLVIDNKPLINAPGYLQSIEVITLSLDRFFERNKVTSVDLLKLDTEGAEDMILHSEGFKKVAPMIKMMEVEFHHPDWLPLVEFVKTFGFDAKHMDSLGNVVLFTRQEQ